MELYVLVVIQATFGLVHPVAVERGLIITFLVVACVSKHVVEFVSVVLAVFPVPLVIKTQYVYVLESMVTGQFKCRGSTAPSQAGF